MDGLPLRLHLGENARATRPTPACRFFSRGTCRDGNNCRFSHVASSETATRGPESNTATSQTDTRSRVICQFYLRGFCRNGSTCPYAHNKDDGVNLQMPQKEEEDKPDDWVREVFGTIAHFGGGARVLKISLPSDFSAVHLGMLPPEASITSIIALLSDNGFTVPRQCIRLIPQGNSMHRSADVRMEDDSFAKRLCSKLGGKMDTSGRVPNVTAVPITASMPQGSSSRRVDSKKVHCSWHRPSRVVWLNFGNESIAKKIHEKFATGIYRILGREVQSNAPRGSDTSGQAWLRNPLAWTIVLNDVPAMASASDVIQSIPPSIRPRHVELGKPTYDVNIAAANTLVKSMLADIGPLEWWEDATGLGGKRAKSKARFTDEADARKAAASLNMATLPFGKNVKLTIQLVNSAKWKVLDMIYNAVRGQLETEMVTWKVQYLIFIAYEPIHGHRVLKLEGEDNTKVAQAKNTIENILGGEVATHEGKPIWSPSFGSNGQVWREVKAVMQKLGVVISRNRRKSCLHIYGPSELCIEAQKLLANLAIHDTSTGHAIELDQQKFVWACRGGFKLMSAALGQGIVTLDIISTPKRLLVTGSSEDYKSALKMVNDQITLDQSELAEKNEKDCTICWTETDNPVVTRCNHTYCSECFETFCFSGATGNKDLCIRCEGDSSQCKSVLGLDELQEYLSSSTFEDLLEASFKTYIRLRPLDFCYCPTPDCAQVYRATSNTALFTCPDCLAAICTKCRASHPDMTCADHKYHISGGHEALEKVKKKLGIKDCPKCKTPMEKTEGCNHMTCGGCGIHICWVCMRTFQEATLCYKHMNREHGGIGLQIPDLL
ncbi:uncharacterized protein BCR38DRAFT_464210 [Pseudomassariella vexata]|uniref:RING-type E3 ubiquitin transferase n=1 Tax=Pseudomassariella vexata TaxID=1141098 RepID=A0A1Y2EBK2_9PEZI|nr:uncharacterized protein BCR38DRAFT_464210 [Pseudomassariella vexata]ORY68942.1 hypothetical protein BCR38DRAFT_464210 [Pseudomassariella vexata]